MQTGVNIFWYLFKDLAWLGNGIFFFISFAECIPFIGTMFPGGTLTSISGFLAAQHFFSIWDVLIFIGLGAFVGDYLGYSLGRWGRPWLDKRGWINQKLLEKGERMFAKHGKFGLFWGRFFGATRALVPFSAGASRMSQKQFFIWEIPSVIFWTFLNVGMGYFSGNIVSLLSEKWSHPITLSAIIIALIGLAFFLIRRSGWKLWKIFRTRVEYITRKFAATKLYDYIKHYPAVLEFLYSRYEGEKIFEFLLLILTVVIMYIVALILKPIL